MLNDPLANTLSKMQNYDKTGKKECTISPSSKIIKAVLTILNEKMFIGKFEESTHSRGTSLKIHLLGMINKVGVIKPRFAISLAEYEKFEKRYLPAKWMGVILVSTSKGLMTHDEAKEKQLGGRLIAYCY